jgi:MFS family permease
MPVLFKEISEDIGLNLVQVGTIWGMIGLSGMFVALVAGLLGDRYGTRLTLATCCFMLGIAGALRGISHSFAELAAFMFLYGLFAVPITFTTHKAAGQWFSGKQLGLANGVLAMGIGAGITLATMFSATVFSPAVGGWRNLMFIYGGVAVLVSLLWFQTRRTPSGKADGTPSAVTVPFRQSLPHVARIKMIWLIAISQAFINGSRAGLNGYLPLYLSNLGWSEAAAGGSLAALSAASVIGVVPLSLLSDKIGYRKRIVYLAIIMQIIGVGLLSIVHNSFVWVLVIGIGLAIEGLAAGMITIIMETKGIGGTYAGTALGLNNTIALTGAFFSPPLGNMLAEINPSLAWIFWAGLATVGLCLFYFVEETGWKKREIITEINQGTT